MSIFNYLDMILTHVAYDLDKIWICFMHVYKMLQLKSAYEMLHITIRCSVSSLSL